MAKYVDICFFPISKKNLAAYKKNTGSIGKLLLKHGALASRDFVADDVNATKDMFPKMIKIKPSEVLIFAVAEFNSKAHRAKVFKLMEKDPAMEKLMSNDLVDPKRMVMGGFKSLVDLER
ncbi:MAG: DUF1428 family protein [Bdellovibrionales bacterium]|nr:DUF1428 family protein [Bdellovibrionales bacterium]